MTPEIVFGPPGTGKTTELIGLPPDVPNPSGFEGILERELKTVRPEEIAYVSFTREGSDQGRIRAMKKFGFGAKDFPYFRTLHSMAFQALGLERSMVMGREQYRDFSAKMGMHFTGYYTEDLHHDDDMYLFFDELYRNNPRMAETYLSFMNVKTLQYVRNNYASYRKTFAMMDFTDMIEVFCSKNIQIPVRVAIIDEAQDLTTLQWKAIFQGFRGVERMYIAGDDDQAIYQWSGADVDYFLGIEGNIRVLKHSYRLPDSILRYAGRITKQIGKRVDKDYVGTGQEGLVDIHSSIDDIQIRPNETYMFLSRNNTFLDDVEKYIVSKGLLYRRKRKASATRDEYSAITTYEKCRRKGSVDLMEEAVLRYVTKEGYDIRAPWYDSFSWSPDKLIYFRDLVAKKVSLDDNNITIGTIHSVKGGEADNVVILMDVTRSVMSNIEKNPDSEHRAFYVGCTRAKKELHIVNSNTKYAYKIYGSKE
jgi:superfamily I DNA/RNA helicase